jgi:hypothetical protein
MADNDAPQGAVPPKISPIAKPEGPAPVTPAGAPRPITVRLKPMAAPTAAPAAPVPAAAPHAPANPKATSRVPVPDAVASAASAAIRPATVRLRPVAPPASAAASAQTPGSTQAITQVELSSTAPIAPIAPVQPQPQPPPTPGGHPLPDGPKPPSTAQVQAAKSKTSRISLDAAIGVTPVAADKEGPKTIRLKRPSDLAAPAAVPTVSTKAPVAPAVQASARKTSRIPDSALPISAASGDDSAGVTQKKTLKIKRPGAKPEADAESAATGGEGFPEGVQLTPLSPLDFPAKGESPVFTTVAVVCASAAAVLLLLLTLCLGAHAVGPDAGPNAVASVKLGQTQIPWPGGIAD